MFHLRPVLLEPNTDRRYATFTFRQRNLSAGRLWARKFHQSRPIGRPCASDNGSRNKFSLACSTVRAGTLLRLWWLVLFFYTISSMSLCLKQSLYHISYSFLIPDMPSIFVRVGQFERCKEGSLHNRAGFNSVWQYYEFSDRNFNRATCGTV